jgi:hypothetical protein
MTDELTPEEREALQNLPRERMPIGLEARVVEAMREHGFLAKRRRMIAVTTGRVAGLLAACVALIIGAYSIGLQRGGGDSVLPTSAPVETDDRVRAEKPAVVAPEKKVEPSLDHVREAESPAVAKTDRPALPQSKPEKALSPSEVPTARSDEATASDVGKTEVAEEGLATAAKERAVAQPEAAPATEAAAEALAGRAQPQRMTAARPGAKQPLTFILNGSPVTVQADSVRVVQDERGRTLVIYTSDGVIRVPLAAKD